MLPTTTFLFISTFLSDHWENRNKIVKIDLEWVRRENWTWWRFNLELHSEFVHLLKRQNRLINGKYQPEIAREEGRNLTVRDCSLVFICSDVQEPGAVDPGRIQRTREAQTPLQLCREGLREGSTSLKWEEIQVEESGIFCHHCEEDVTTGWDGSALDS